MKATIHTDPVYQTATIDRRLYSSFIEHLGRAVYDGIYNPEHPTADEMGFRKDVIEVLRPLNIPLIRYPGGNFVSGFCWEDSVGPREARPRRLELAWRSIETNQVGLHEFDHWCKSIGAQMMMAVNLGSRGMEDACRLLEYCNHPSGTLLSDLRISHGAREPYNIRTWCLGNEMDGPWQLGHKTADEYGRLACETARAMRQIDPAIELVATGSSSPGMKTFPEWEATVLGHTYEDVDYLSLHQYLGNFDDDLDDYLAMSLSTDHFIHTVEAACDYVKAKKRSKKKMMFSFDEWNIWYHSNKNDNEHMEKKPWEIAPSLLEDIYTAADAVVFGSMLITLMKHADRVRIACLAQLVNVIAPVMTERNGGSVWRQTIYWPFAQAARYGQGTVLTSIIQSPKYDSRNYCDVPYLEAVCIHDREAGNLTIFAVNRNRVEALELECSLRAFGSCTLLEHSALYDADPDRVNGPGCKQVSPGNVAGTEIDDGVLRAQLPPLSWNMIRVQTVKEK